MREPKVDMFAELRSHLQHLREEPRSEWDPEDEYRALIASKHVSQYVVRVNEILVSINNNLVSNVSRASVPYVTLLLRRIDY